MELPPAYSPQALHDILPIYRPNDADYRIHTYALRQCSADSQTLIHTSEDDAPQPMYGIKTFKTGGFMNRKPHIIITSGGTDTKTPIAEARFDIHGTGTSISYLKPPNVQRLELADSRSQLLSTVIRGSEYWWQPFVGNKDVLELTNEDRVVVARFVHTGRTASAAAMNLLDKKGKVKGKTGEVQVGELHVVDAFVGGEEERTEILCSAIVVVERAKRRKSILNHGVGGFAMAGTVGATYIPQ